MSPMALEPMKTVEIPNHVLACMAEPVVSVRVITYNHAPFIRKCIEGILMQQTDFDVEIIIGEDQSTDGTREIVMAYAERYPEQIRVLTSDQNIGGMENAYRCRPYLRGRYVAFCEGDDYWTDPLKLQKQINFLEAHPAYVGVGMDFATADAEGRIVSKSADIIKTLRSDENGQLITNSPKTLTVVYRWNDVFFNQLNHFRKVMMDCVYAEIMLKYGKIAIIPTISGVYTRHNGGIYSEVGRVKQLKLSIQAREDAMEIGRSLGIDLFSETIIYKLYLHLMIELFKQKEYDQLYQLIRKKPALISPRVISIIFQWLSKAYLKK